MRHAFVTLLALTLAVAGCTTVPPTSDGNGTGPSDDVPPPREDGPRFNATRAFALAEEQVLYPNGSVRHRVPGTPGNAEAAALIAGHLADAGLDARYHHFNATYGCERTAMHNVVGTLPGATDRVFYVGAHYDTRPIAENDPDPDRTDDPIPGANDGASGVGVVLELARVLAAGPELNATLVFLFFDGEDGGEYLGEDCTDWILGSRAFVDDLTEADVARADGMLLADLVGDPGAVFPREGFSAAEPHKALGDAVWAVANGLGFTRFTNATSWHITDDHVPFQDAGIPSVDVIDVRSDRPAFPATHHTHADDLSNISPEPMGEVGLTFQHYLVERYGSS